MAPTETTQGSTKLLKEYDALVEAIDDASLDETWALADWLVANVEVRKPGPQPQLHRPSGVTIAELAKRPRSYSESWLREMRATAAKFPPGGARIASLKAHSAAYAKAGTVEGAFKALDREVAAKGRASLRSQAPAMESVPAIQRNLAGRPPQERAKVAAELLADPQVRNEVIDRAPKVAEDLGTDVLLRAQGTTRGEVEQRGRQNEQVKRERQGWLLLDGELDKVRRSLRDCLLLVRETNVPQEQREFLRDDVREIIEAAETLELALLGQATIDWDAALAKLAEQGA